MEKVNYGDTNYVITNYGVITITVTRAQLHHFHRSPRGFSFFIKGAGGGRDQNDQNVQASPQSVIATVGCVLATLGHDEICLGVGAHQAGAAPAPARHGLLGRDFARDEFELKDGPKGRRRRRGAIGRSSERPFWRTTYDVSLTSSSSRAPLRQANHDEIRLRRRLTRPESERKLKRKFSE